MNRKTSGSATASAVLFVTSGMLASVLGVRQYDRVTTEAGWVASSYIAAGQVLTREALEPARLSKDAPVIKDPRRLIGQRLKMPKAAGEAFSPGDLISQTVVRRTLSQQVPEGRVLYTLELGARGSIPFTELRGGDRLDVLVRGRAGVRTAATDVRLIGVMGPKFSARAAQADSNVMSLLPQRAGARQSLRDAASLVIAVHPQHVYPLANIGSKDQVSLVLHSASDVNRGAAVSVTPVRAQREVEVLSGLTRTVVYVDRQRSAAGQAGPGMGR